MTFRPYKLASVLFILAASLSLTTTAQANNQTCFNAVQGKVAWNYAEAKMWNPSNIEALCSGNEVSTAPADCFNSVMHERLNWGEGDDWQWSETSKLCSGSVSAESTIQCFRDEVTNGYSKAVAIRNCTSDKIRAQVQNNPDDTGDTYPEDTKISDWMNAQSSVEQSLELLQLSLNALAYDDSQWPQELEKLETSLPDDVALHIQNIQSMAHTVENGPASLDSCVIDGLADQIQSELEIVKKWLLGEKENSLYFPPSICKNTPKFIDITDGNKWRHLDVYGFRLGQNPKLKYWAESSNARTRVAARLLNDEAYNRPRNKNHISFLLENFKIEQGAPRGKLAGTLKEIVPEVAEQELQTLKSQIVIKFNAPEGYKDFQHRINVKGKTYDWYEEQAAQSLASEKQSNVCGMPKSVETKARNNRVIWLDRPGSRFIRSKVQGDYAFNWDVNFDIKYNISLSQDKKKVLLDIVEINARECCNCHGHNRDTICQMNFNGNENSQYKFTQFKPITLLSVPDEYNEKYTLEVSKIKTGSFSEPLFITGRSGDIVLGDIPLIADVAEVISGIATAGMTEASIAIGDPITIATSETATRSRNGLSDIKVGKTGGRPVGKPLMTNKVPTVDGLFLTLENFENEEQSGSPKRLLVKYSDGNIPLVRSQICSRSNDQ